MVRNAPPSLDSKPFPARWRQVQHLDTLARKPWLKPDTIVAHPMCNASKSLKTDHHRGRHLHSQARQLSNMWYALAPSQSLHGIHFIIKENKCLIGCKNYDEQVQRYWLVVRKLLRRKVRMSGIVLLLDITLLHLDRRRELATYAASVSYAKRFCLQYTWAERDSVCRTSFAIRGLIRFEVIVLVVTQSGVVLCFVTSYSL